MSAGATNPKSNLQVSKPDIIPVYDQEGFAQLGVDADAWNQLYPYQLIILHVNEDATYDVTPWRFSLPITPQQITVTMPVADTIQPTLTGYNEVLGGAPFRNINMQGTMGVWPARESVVRGGASGLSAIAKTAVAPVVNAATELVTGAPPRLDNAMSESIFPTATTGFYRFHQLRQFLEGYVALRRRTDPIKPGDEDKIGTAYRGKATLHPHRLRLALAVWKDNSVYVCRIQQFDGPIKDAARPLEYRWSLALQAYKRVDINEQGQAASEFKINVSKVNRLFDIMNRINAARKLLAASQNLLAFGVLGPLSIINELSRQISGAVKDVAGIVRSIRDMPITFVRSVVSDILDTTKQVGAGFGSVASTFRSFDKFDDDIKAALAPLRSQMGVGPKSDHGPTLMADTASSTGALTVDTTAQPGQSQQSEFTDGSQVGSPPINTTGIDPQEALDAAPGLSDLNLDNFSLSAAQRAALNAEQAQSLSKSVSDFEDIRDSIQQNLDIFTTSIGSWDPVYNEIYGLPEPAVPQRAPTPEELDIIFAANEILISADQFVAYLKDNQNQVDPVPSSLEYVAGLAQQSGIFFQIPRSKIAVPFPYGHSLERIALQYLGDANRWHEIATLNGLREPYIDEEGFYRPLLTNATDRQIAIESSENLFIGQQVYLTSDTQNATVRTIIDINKLTPGQAVITLDGDTNVEAYLASEHAALRAFLPGTVNSSSLIYIPTAGDPVTQQTDLNIPGINPLDPLIRLGGIDLLLTDRLDLVVTPNGDNPLSIGMINMTQTVKLALSTQPGSLLQHPTWGFDARPGDSVADVDLQALIKNLRTIFSGDLDFAGIRSALVQKVGNVLRLDIQLGINGINRSVPVLLSLGSRPGQS